MATVLVVDDTASIRMLVRANLELAGYSVNEATDGVECIELLQHSPRHYDVVALDVMMPRLGGFEAALAIRDSAELSHIAVILMSTQAQESDIDRAQAAGADAFIVKPFDPDRLVAVVNTVLGSGDASLWAPSPVESGRAATQRRRSHNATRGPRALGDSLDQ